MIKYHRTCTFQGFEYFTLHLLPSNSDSPFVGRESSSSCSGRTVWERAEKEKAGWTETRLRWMHSWEVEKKSERSARRPYAGFVLYESNSRIWRRVSKVREKGMLPPFTLTRCVEFHRNDNVWINQVIQYILRCQSSWPFLTDTSTRPCEGNCKGKWRISILLLKVTVMWFPAQH